MREFLVFSKNLVIHRLFQFIFEFLFLTLELSSAHSEAEVFCIKGIPKYLSKFMGKHPFQSLHKKDALAKVFSFEFCVIFKNTFLYRTLRWLHLARINLTWSWSWLHVIIKSRTCFIVNLYSVVCLNVKELPSQSRRYMQCCKHSSIIWAVCLNGWVFVYKLSGCGFESCCCHLNLWSWWCQLFLKKNPNKFKFRLTF